jgi:hypothetical protein
VSKSGGPLLGCSVSVWGASSALRSEIFCPALTVADAGWNLKSVLRMVVVGWAASPTAAARASCSRLRARPPSGSRSRLPNAGTTSCSRRCSESENATSTREQLYDDAAARR